MTLSITPITLVAASILITLAAAGCETKEAHHRNAELRWQKTLEQAKLDYAQQYLDKGQYVQATALLEPMAVSHNNPEAKVLLDQIEQQQFASAIPPASSGDF